MESKLNHTELDRYAKDYTDKVIRPFFAQKEKATGGELLEISPVNQVNRLVVMALFQAWKKEFSKLKSPYFDYGHKEVRGALKDFMNVLSRHIAVDERTLRPLMQSAVRQTLLIIFSPYDFFAQLINSRDHTRVHLNDLKEWRKYIKVNRNLMDGLIGRFQEEELKEAFNDEAFRLFNEVVESGTQEPEDSDPYLAELNAVVPLSLERIWGDTGGTKSVAKEPEPVKKVTPLVMEDDDEEEDTHDGPPTLNDQLRREQKTLVDLHQEQPISSIKQHITINQRYMFVRDLFANDNEAFNQAIERVEEQSTLDDALRVLVDDFASHRGWDMESGPVTELLDVISKRYA